MYAYGMHILSYTIHSTVYVYGYINSLHAFRSEENDEITISLPRNLKLYGLQEVLSGRCEEETPSGGCSSVCCCTCEGAGASGNEGG